MQTESLKFSIKSLLVVFVILSLLIVPIAWLLDHGRHWGPAEKVENALSQLRSDFPETDLTEAAILEAIESPDHPHHWLVQHHAKIEKLPGEVIWFAPNSRYSIGLKSDGMIIWMHEGER